MRLSIVQIWISLFVAGALAANSTLLSFVLKPLPLGSIKPQGWLRDQMELMANGLAGHEHDFYRYVAKSLWLGGDQEYSTLNEGFPYWLNGLVPLAYGLDDARLKDQVQQSVDYLIKNQQKDGWIGPETTPHTRNLWARYPVFLGLTQLVEANPSQAKSLVPAMHKFVGLMHFMLTNNYTGYVFHPGDDFDALWGRAREQDMMISLQWLLEKYPEGNSQILLESMELLLEQAYDWAYWFSEGVFIKVDLNTVPADLTNSLFHFEHGVNAAQGLKALAVINRFTHNASLPTITRQGVNWVFEYHGQSSGSVLGDERMEGLAPYTGSELCTAVEVMYSLSYLYQAMGDNQFADRCELAAFNALPVMVTDDWWAHQYMQQSNQPYSRHLTDTPFFNVRGDGQTFGLEPQYPCCTVNHPQGYPKFLSASFTAVGDNGLAHVLLSPATVTTTIGNGNEVSISCDTTYPFDKELTYTITATEEFSFYFRVPAWSSGGSSSVKINGSKGKPLSPDPHTGLHEIAIQAGKTTVEYTVNPTIVVEPRANSTIAIHYGSLLYALEIGSVVSTSPPVYWENRTQYPTGYAPPQALQYTMNHTTPWNYAIDPATLKYHTRLEYCNGNTQLPNPIFTAGAPPGYMTVQACEIEWPLFKDVPAAVPLPGHRTCMSAKSEVTLIPYGAAKIHMAEFPTMDH